jgi:hypothetical protein
MFSSLSKVSNSSFGYYQIKINNVYDFEYALNLLLCSIKLEVEDCSLRATLFVARYR